jgi:hypothetical protein
MITIGLPVTLRVNLRLLIMSQRNSIKAIVFKISKDKIET